MVAVGRLQASQLAEMESEYGKRLRGPIGIKEVEERRALPPADRKAKEGELLLAALPEDALLVALDERGTALTSAGFADRLHRWRLDGVKTLPFVIGGADGLAQPLLQRASVTLSL